MVSGKVTVKNPTGLHLRPAGTLCKQAMQFKSSITFHYGDGNTANAKSVLSVLGACVKCGGIVFRNFNRIAFIRQLCKCLLGSGNGDFLRCGIDIFNLIAVCRMAMSS